MPRCFYLHGFASGPQSYKAQYLRARLAEVGQTLLVPDFNTGGFLGLSLTRQIEQVSQLISRFPEPTILIGSSFGGLTAAWVAERCPQVAQIILLAPAFEFSKYLQLHLGERYAQWRQDRDILLYHHGYGRESGLSYGFVEDLTRYRDAALKRSLPTLIIHGRQDEIIPASVSQRYQSSRPWVTLDLIADDHSLTESISYIWRCIRPALSR
ncbi:MAG: YqiA/YcfP family alpha/beta fold hydrolase [Elainellaceae cyanobacterium]